MATSQENMPQMVVKDESANAADRSTRPAEPRRVLGELSTNAQITPKAKSIFKTQRLMTAPPVKRSFASTIDDSGFTYLKRRRLSWSDNVPSAWKSDSIAKDIEAVGVMHVPHADASPDTSEHGSEGDRESSTERQSFSSLINYDPSSQMMPSSQARASAALADSILQPQPLSQAERLKLRLKIAMYKVRTEQTAVSFEYLREDTASGSRESNIAVREAVQQLREEALARLSLPAKRPFFPSQALVSAITPTVSPLKGHIRDRILAATPHHGSPNKLDSNADLTSSAVKGQVAEGLLGLKHGFDR